MATRTCPKCKQTRDDADFYIGSSKQCKGCMTWQNLSYNAKKEGHILEFTAATFHAFYGSSATRRCHYCGITEAAFTSLGRKNTRGYHTQTLGLDRSDSAHGYNANNARVACLVCNRIKSDIFTEDEMKTIGAAIGQVWKQRGLA